MKEFIFEVERRVYGWMKDRLSIEAETPEEALEKLKEMAEDATGHMWSLNRYENDMLTVGCHRIAYNEMERIAKQLGWV